MRVALCQFDPLVGAVFHNAKRISDFALSAYQQGAELVIFPELAICGYPPKDILFHQELTAQIEVALSQLAKSTPIPLVVGAPVRHRKNTGQPFWNAALYCFAGEVKIVARKRLLPNYDVFDERRYFEPGTDADGDNLLRFGDIVFGFTICEDAWNDEQFWPERRYELDPVADVVARGANVVVNIAASPFSVHKPALRESMLGHLAKRHSRPLLMAGQVGANDQLIFDGSSAFFDKDGKVLARLDAFREGLLMADIGREGVRAIELREVPPLPARIELMASALTLGIRDYVEKCRAPGVLIGLSGGVDSAVTAVLAVRALGPERVIGVRMPSRFSSEHSLVDAQELAANLGIAIQDVSIESVVDSYRAALGKNWQSCLPAEADIADQNLQARTRGMILMALSNMNHHLVLATGNKSEMSVGYATLYGDMCGALAPLADVYKSDVWALGHYFNQGGPCIPERTIDKTPSAELKENQSDQDSLPPYDVLDPALFRYVDCQMPVEQIAIETGMTIDSLRSIVRLVHANDYKRRQAAVILMVSGSVFGEGRRWPAAKGFEPFSSWH